MTLEVQRQNAKHNHNFMSRAKGKNSVLYSSLRASAERGLLPLCHGSYFDAVASLEVVRWGDKLQALGLRHPYFSAGKRCSECGGASE